MLLLRKFFSGTRLHINDNSKLSTKPDANLSKYECYHNGKQVNFLHEILPLLYNNDIKYCYKYHLCISALANTTKIQNNALI